MEDNDILIPEPRFLGINGVDLIDDINKVFDYINEAETPENLELDKIERVRKI